MNARGIETLKEQVQEWQLDTELDELVIRLVYPDGQAIAIDVLEICQFDDAGNVQHSNGLLDLRHISRVEW